MWREHPIRSAPRCPKTRCRWTHTICSKLSLVRFAVAMFGNIEEAVMDLVRLMQTTVGRIARIVLGGALIVLGVTLGGGWLALVALGLVAIFAGSAGVWFAAPLVHAPLRNTERS